MNWRFCRTAAFLFSLPVIAAQGPGLIQVTGIQVWSHQDFTRVIFATTGAFDVHSERAYNPDRIFFDVAHARPWIDGHRYATHVIGDALIQRVRVAETTQDTTRIVFDLNAAATFRMMHLDHPDRIVIELRPASSSFPVTPPPAVTRDFPPAPLPYIPPVPVRRSSYVPPPAPPRLRFNAVLLADNPPLLDTAPLPWLYLPDSLPSASRAKLRKVLIVRTTPSPAPPVPPPALPAPALSASNPAPLKPVPYDAMARPSESATRSLTRALGLKINRIVIDAGHGGHDYGTIGPNGTNEKEVVLDVALRLSQLIQTRMGADVVLTRSDDTFVPLPQRTAIANDRKADLFLSIHANSSAVSTVAGTETFFLNFTNSATALDVAARENAGADKSVSELKDLIQSITLNDKIAESEAFAQSIQDSLYSQAARSNVAAKNRGVKRAPFVVLIGAGMPSVLAEIGFLSNARDEANLAKPEYRQKIAEALYKGLSQYAQSLSHFDVAAGKLNKSVRPAAGMN